MAHLLGLGLSFQGPWKAAGMWPKDPMGMGATDWALPALIRCVLRPLWMVLWRCVGEPECGVLPGGWPKTGVPWDPEFGDSVVLLHLDTIPGKPRVS